MIERTQITYKDLQQVVSAFKNSKPEFTNRFYCNEWHVLADSDIKELYPRSRIKRIKIARRSENKYLFTWKGLRFYLIYPNIHSYRLLFIIRLQIFLQGL